MICAALIAVALAVLALGLALWTGALDTGCTGFQWAEWVWPTIRQCCTAHDLGGTDGGLLDCLLTGLPGWPMSFGYGSKTAPDCIPQETLP